MKIKNRFTLCILLTLLCGCSRCKPVKKTPKPPHQVVFVLCDFTKSIDSSREDLKKNILEVVQSLPQNTDYFFYRINEGINDAFFKGRTLTGDLADLRSMLHLRDECMPIIDSLYKNDRSNFTCIKTNIEAMKSNIQLYQADTTCKKIHLIILSDMLECCMWDNGKVNLERNSFEEANRILDKQQMSPLSTNTSNIQIGIILSSSKALQYEHIKNFWNAYFKKINYDKDVVWCTDLPGVFFTK